jgi:hypothetical protein
MESRTDILIVTHLHDDGSPAAGQTIDTTGELHPWRNLAHLTIDEVARVTDETGRPAYLVDYDDGTRVDQAFANVNDALAAANAA